MLIRAILPQWAAEKSPSLRRVREGEFNEAQIADLIADSYNVYYLPNSPSQLPSGRPVDGTDIDTFSCVFVDMDLKEGTYADKDSFIQALYDFPKPPSSLVDSGNGVHAFWRVSDLDALSFLRLQRRLCRHLKTDEAVAKVYQLMRLPNTVNTKKEHDLKLCEELYSTGTVYTCEELDKALPLVTQEDEAYCQEHYNNTYNPGVKQSVDEALPRKFGQLIASNKEAKELYAGNVEDRSKADYRLGHLMFANGFTKPEAMSVLVNTAKALERAPTHRVNYAQNIVEKIWTFDIQQEGKLSYSVRDILSRGEETISGTRFPCHPLIDNTVGGFRLGHVIGLVAGSGVGKTAFAINMFKWFTERNPEYDHFFVSLEQTDNEIASRWRTVCQGDERLHDKVHVLSNYAPDGTFRRLSLSDIKTYLVEFQKETGRKIGTCVIDHIGALSKDSKNGENQGIVDICHQMKSFAVETGTLLVMQSQAPREKAGIGDLELDKSAAYGTVFFESYVDFLLTIWQPLKRVYTMGAPTTMAFKYAKIRHKKQGQDKIQEDVCYRMFFDPKTEQLRELTSDEEKSFDYYNKQATSKRKEDRKTDLVSYVSVKNEGEPGNGKPSTDQNVEGIRRLN